ncbi:MAG TPA: hypothetical protein VFM18_06760 [Methanosarcina sp.]|nr:hypothetical protein [Methanosarcina sp.]
MILVKTCLKIARNMKKETKKYPDWICAACGIKYGKQSCDIATWHSGKCDVCGEDAIVTEPRDFGHLVKNWEYEAKK